MEAKLKRGEKNVDKKNKTEKFNKRVFASLKLHGFARHVRAAGTKCSCLGNRQIKIIYGIMVNGMMHKLFSKRESKKRFQISGMFHKGGIYVP